MRQIVLDTETTGLPSQEEEGKHRIIEVACVELIDRRITSRHFHYYINPERVVDPGAFAIHGLSNEFLADKPCFKDIVHEFIDFIKDAELIIHNAAFDVGFLNYELGVLLLENIERYCSITDTLAIARRLHPGQRNSLDALCKRYNVDNSQRDLHGALLDARLLAHVYLAMTGGQDSLFGDEDSGQSGHNKLTITMPPAFTGSRPPLVVIEATPEEEQAHTNYLNAIEKTAEAGCLWLQMENNAHQIQ
jgi:DNA polymerase-3 subunit epsilon